MKRKLFEGIIIGVAAALVALLIWRTGILDRWEYIAWGWPAQFFAKPSPATDKIKLILLDQASLDWGKQNGLPWPWPREVYSPIIDFCKRHGARAVIFDVLYSEPSASGVEDDLRLAESIRRAPVFVGSLCLQEEGGTSTSWPANLSGQLSFKIENLEKYLAGTNGKELVSPWATFPIEELGSPATVLANVIEDPDMDGIFRRVHLFKIFDNRVVPSLGFAAFGTGCGESQPDGEQVCTGKFVEDRLQICGKSIPLDSENKLILRFRGPSGTFQSLRASAVIESELLARSGEKKTVVDGSSFKDAYVFFGFNAPALLDLRPTPLSRDCSGTEIHATLLDNLLTGDFLRDAPPAAVALSTLLLSLLAGISVVIFSKHAAHSAMVFVLIAPLPSALGFAAYPLGLRWPIVVGESAVLLALIAGIVVNYATEGRKKTFYKKAFSQYLSPAVIERIIADPSRLKLGGERRELSIFFSDLEGFSSFSEKLDPETLTSLLNEYLSEMTDIILDEEGTLDKYEGDAIIAFWNAPEEQLDHAERACRAALRCQKRLQELRDYFLKKTGTLLRARIGLNTGEVVVGNMGSRKRFDYTVLGDAANLASRLEGANKAFGTFLMVSEATWQKTSGKFEGRQIGLIRVVGRGTPVRVFEPTGLKAEGQTASAKRYEQALGYCFEKEWQKALEIFESLPDDPVSRLYADRCRDLIQNPDESWDGVWKLDSK